MMDFLQCLGSPNWVSYAVALGLFVLAILLYWIFFSTVRSFLRKDGVWKSIVESIRYPVLVILLEIAAVISVEIIGIKEHYEDGVQRVVLIIMILTIGWVVGSIVHALYQHFMQKYESGGDVRKEERAMATQILFLYRFSMFLIVSLTIASVMMTFPHIKTVGIGILSSAGIAGIALGVAARPILLNLMAGFQIAMTKTIKIGDAVFLENDFARIEAIHLTHVVARTWDLRRIVLPISYFIDHPFQNWDAKDPELLGSVFIYCDYTAPVEEIRKKIEELVHSHPNWNQKVWRMHVTNCSEKTIELRIIMTANDAPTAFELRSYVREKIIEFLQTEHPYALPCTRIQGIKGL